MADIQLYRLISRYSTNPNQPPIAVSDAFNVEAGESVLVDVLANDNCLISLTKTLVSVASFDNCTASVAGGLVSVIGTAEGAGSFSYTVSDGTNSAVGVVTLTIADSLVGVLIADGTHTDFGDEVETGDTLHHSATTENGEAVAVNGLGHVSITGDYVAGDSFAYRVNSGALQTFTFL
jgi:hypothetical protein